MSFIDMLLALIIELFKEKVSQENVSLIHC
jgi:hypothetical protein